MELLELGKSLEFNDEPVTVAVCCDGNVYDFLQVIKITRSRTNEFYLEKINGNIIIVPAGGYSYIEIGEIIGEEE